MARDLAERVEIWRSKKGGRWETSGEDGKMEEEEEEKDGLGRNICGESEMK